MANRAGVSNELTSGSKIIDSKIETELDKSIYNRALAMPESLTISYSYVDASFGQVMFNGGNSYICTKDGWVINKEKTNIKAQPGWIAVLSNTPDYVYFTGTDDTFFAKLSDTEPIPLVESFEPLYDKLKELQYENDTSIVNDTKNAAAVATTNKDSSSEAINKDSDSKDLVSSGSSSKESSTGEQTKDKNSKHANMIGSVYPRQIKTSNNDKKNDSVYNNIQAVVYDLHGYQSANSPSSLSDSIHHLFCYQQPDNVSYTAAASFQSESPRGTQQPFQFYQNHSAMELTFELRWHIDEIRTLSKDGKQSYTIQDIARIAEDFTRPWGDDGLHPKLCKVILPGVSQIGYITNAQISYSGDMSGDYTPGAGVLTENGTKIEPRSIYNYFYSQISVTFTMIIVKDVKLLSANDPKGLSVAISAEGEDIKKPDNIPADQDAIEAEKKAIEEAEIDAQIAAGVTQSKDPSQQEVPASMMSDQPEPNMSQAQPADFNGTDEKGQNNFIDKAASQVKSSISSSSSSSSSSGQFSGQPE